MFEGPIPPVRTVSMSNNIQTLLSSFSLVYSHFIPIFSRFIRFSSLCTFPAAFPSLSNETNGSIERIKPVSHHAFLPSIIFPIKLLNFSNKLHFYPALSLYLLTYSQLEVYSCRGEKRRRFESGNFTT